MIFTARASENDPDHSMSVKKGKMALFFQIFAPIAVKFGYTWRMKRFLLGLVACVVVGVASVSQVAAQAKGSVSKPIYQKAVIQDMKLSPDPAGQGVAGTFVLKLESQSKLLTLKANVPDLMAKTLHTGSTVIVSRTDYGGNTVYQIVDVYRMWPLLVLFLVFAALVVWVARGQGVLAFVGMLLSFGVILQLVVPQILSGTNAIVVALLASVLMLPLIFYLGHGFHMKTTVAIISTFITLVVTSILGYIMVHAASLTGLTDEHVYFIQGISDNPFAIRDLLFAGFVIGALGILDDVSISQTSITYELHDTNPKLSSSELFSRSMRVGRDHVSSLVNTLVLVYAGAALPLFLLFQQQQTRMDIALSSELIATEIVRTLVVSIGVVASVPITTALAVWFVKRS